MMMMKIKSMLNKMDGSITEFKSINSNKFLESFVLKGGKLKEMKTFSTSMTKEKEQAPQKEILHGF
jgi:hypothetical protein